MSYARLPKPALPVFGLLLAGEVSLDAVKGAVEEAFGPLGEITTPTSFRRSGYYEREMGETITRLWCAAKEPADRGELPAWKRRACEIETRFTKEGKRRLNLDPGYLTLTQVVLASCKPSSYRVHLEGGIWAEVEYRYEWGGFVPLPWTYPDYRDPGALAFFDALRERLRLWRKEARCFGA